MPVNVCVSENSFVNRGQAAPDPASDAMTVLLIDDEPSIRYLFRTALEKEGYRVLEAQDGRAALPQIPATGVDLVITDLLMDGQEGLETIQILHRRHPTLEILVVSGAGDPIYFDMARAFGASRCVEKPVSPSRLVSEVRQAISKRFVSFQE